MTRDDTPDARSPAPREGVSGMRLVLFSERYEEAVAFFRDGLGLPVRDVHSDGRRDSTLFAAGPAGIEVVNEERRIGSGVMLRLEVDDLASYPGSLAACGLRTLGPIRLPWGERMCGVGGPGDLLVDLVEALPPPSGDPRRPSPRRPTSPWSPAWTWRPTRSRCWAWRPARRT